MIIDVGYASARNRSLNCLVPFPFVPNVSHGERPKLQIICRKLVSKINEVYEGYIFIERNIFSQG